MLDRKQRVLLKQVGLTDISASVNDYRDGSAIVALAPGDYLYVGSEYPFNHKHFEIDPANVNANASAINAEYWDGNAWQFVVDIVDETKTAGATFAKSGKVSFAPDTDKPGWSLQDDTKFIPELVTVRIYNLYWARFSVSATLSAATTLKYVGQLFNNDLGLYGMYPDLNNQQIRTAYNASITSPLKTDWREQGLNAAEVIVQDLRTRGILVRRDQIMDETLYTLAGIHQTAAIIYSGLGNGRADQLQAALDSYKSAISIRYHEIDRGSTGRADRTQRNFEQSEIYR